MKNYSWHPMHEDDLPKIKEIMHQAYPDFPEDIRCTRERLRLFPAGCSVLRRDDEGAVLGYVISHPWENLSIPRLSSFLGALPISAEVYYIHDIAMLPDVQGIGAARAMLVQLNQIARSLHIKKFALVAVAAARDYWQARGFRAIYEASLTDSLESYGSGSQYMQRPVD